jgi:hypothetical protein
MTDRKTRRRKGTLAATLKAAIKQTAEATATGVSRLLGVPNNSMATWLNGDHFPRPHIMGRILSRLKLTPAERKVALEDYLQVDDLSDVGLVIVDENLGRAEEVARAFHAAYEKHAPEGSVSWNDVPEHGRALTARAVRELLEQGVLVLPFR